MFLHRLYLDVAKPRDKEQRMSREGEDEATLSPVWSLHSLCKLYICANSANFASHLSLPEAYFCEDNCSSYYTHRDVKLR